MLKQFWKIMLCTLVLCTLFSSFASAASLESKKEELRNKTERTLIKLYQIKPSAEDIIENAPGYAVFNNTGFKLGILGSSHGRGMAVNNETDEEVYMKMQEFQAGLGLGIKEYAVIFVFGSEKLWRDFTTNGWEFGAQASASIDDGVNGESIDGALNVSPGIWMYQMTTKGLALELAVKGTNYFRDKSFYKNEK